MARTIEKLTALAVSKLTEPGLYSDGGGLYLRVSESGAKSWVYRYMRERRPREMGLGPPMLSVSQKLARLLMCEAYVAGCYTEQVNSVRALPGCLNDKGRRSRAKSADW